MVRDVAGPTVLHDTCTAEGLKAALIPLSPSGPKTTEERIWAKVLSENS
jgi:hypothetical protein